jgi:hypothetical protein
LSALMMLLLVKKAGLLTGSKKILSSENYKFLPSQCASLRTTRMADVYTGAKAYTCL